MVDGFIDYYRSRSGRDGQPITDRTLANVLSFVRGFADCAGKKNIVRRDNASYGIGPRTSYATKNKAASLTEVERNLLAEESFRLVAEGQQAFGLRESEGLKFQIRFADRGSYLYLLGSWCKNGRPRVLHIETKAQGAWIAKVWEYAKKTGEKSLIPKGVKFITWLRKYNRELKSLDIASHQMRHHYAHDAYRRYTGLEPRICGGPGLREVSPEMRESIRDAYQKVADQLGHSRKYIASHYLGPMW
jgi:hypothetical protein